MGYKELPPLTHEHHVAFFLDPSTDMCQTFRCTDPFTDLCQTFRCTDSFTDLCQAFRCTDAFVSRRTGASDYTFKSFSEITWEDDLLLG